MALAAALALCLLRCVSGRIISGHATLTGVDTEHELSKFAFSTGKGSVTATFWTDTEYPDDRGLKVHAYLDDEWPAVQRAATCEEKVKFARWTGHVDLEPSGERGDAPSTAKDWAVVTRGISSSIRTHVWYFTVADCSLEVRYHTVPDLHYTVTMLGDGDSHLPIDQLGVAWLHRVNAFASFGLLVALLASVYARANKARQSFDRVHVAVVVLAASIACDVASSLCEVRHVRLYERDGVGSYAADAASAHLEACCDGMLALLLLCLASGWTLSSNLSDDEKCGRSPLAQETLAEQAASACTPLATALRFPARRLPAWSPLVFVGAHLALAQWSRCYDDDFDTFHDLDHPPGKILALSRVVLGLLFVVLASRSKACAGYGALSRFYLGLTVIGAAWFFSLPALVTLAPSVPQYTRHRLVVCGAALAQTAALAGLALLFTGRANGVFHNASTVGDGDDNLDFGKSPSADAPAVAGAFSLSKLKIGKVKLRVD